MIVGFDGKRAFQNKTGLGNYSRSLVAILAHSYPADQFVLLAPKTTDLFSLAGKTNIRVVGPTTTFYKKFPALWRRKGMVKELATLPLDIYHGLSNELPLGIEKLGLKTVVTIHDLIFERFPGTYNFDERYVHRWKIKRACKIADAIIAISNQTRNDLVNIYDIDPRKIYTCYQSANPIFEKLQTLEVLQQVRQCYHLPAKYFLFVSAITPRKNLLDICRALALVKETLDVPLVVIGDGKKEKDEVKHFMAAEGLSHRLIFLNETDAAKEPAFTSANDFPAIYQQAIALVYPSLFEGFGLPILEAMWSGLPVICSNTSSLPEVAGDAALYFTPGDIDTLATHMSELATNNTLAEELRRKGFHQALKFTAEKYAENTRNVYTKIL